MFRLTDKEIKTIRQDCQKGIVFGYEGLYSFVAEYIDKRFGFMSSDAREEITQDMTMVIWSMRHKH